MRQGDNGSIDGILDAGAAGLRYFEVFGPRYREWTGGDPAGGDYFGLAARYDQQRGMDIALLGDLATTLGEELDGRLDDQAATQTTRFAAVPDFWNGSPAADNARGYLTDTGGRVTTNLDALRAVRTAATTAVTQIETAVRTKADTIAEEFTADAAAGKSPQQIDWLIDLAAGRGDTGESTQDRLRSELPEHYVEGVEPATACRNWLDQVFVPEIDAKVARFTTLCAEAHTAVTVGYDQLILAVEAIEPAAFLSPGGAPSADTELGTVSGKPSYLAVVGSQPAVTEPDGDTPPAGQNPARTPEDTPETPTEQDTPSSLALTSAPAAAEISETAEVPGSSTGDPAGTDDGGDPSDTGEPAAPVLEDTAGDGSEPSQEDAGLGGDDPAATPPADTGAATQWTPADITGMVTAVSGITGTIPDLITAVSGLAGNLDEIIGATGDAVATVIDAVDNQPAAAEPPAEGDVPVSEVPEGAAPAGDEGLGQQPAPTDSGEGAAGEEGAQPPAETGLPGEEAAPAQEPVVEEPGQSEQLLDTGDTGEEAGLEPQLPAPTPPLETAASTDPALIAAASSLRGLTPTSSAATGPRPAQVVATDPPETESSLSL
ncbi:hypothetical protein [Nocardia sp. NPDC003345]